MNERDDHASDHTGQHHADHDELVSRLRAAGRIEPPAALQSRHLAAIAAAQTDSEAGSAGIPATGARHTRRRPRLAVGVAAVVGFVAGSLGLGWAGALPGPAQSVAEEVLEQVGVEVRNRGQCVSAAARGNPNDEAAQQEAKEACPKGGPPAGIHSGDHPGARGQGKAGPGKAGNAERVRPHADDPCRGAPPWAGRAAGPTAEESAQFEQQRASCPADE